MLNRLPSSVAKKVLPKVFITNGQKSFWLAGQGGFGIMMAPTLAQATVSLISQDKLQQELLDVGVTTDSLSPNRFFK